jgi:hypothetical protein
MRINSDSIKQGVREAFVDWAIAHEISFPALLEEAVGDAFGNWLDKHSTEIIAAIAKSYVEGKTEPIQGA